MPPSDGSAPQPHGSPRRHEGDADVPERIGKYEIQKKLGAGGMGAVYLAFDPSLKRSCALKVLPKDKATNPTLVKRFKAEGAAAANLTHENIVAVYEANESDGHFYIAMEYVDGVDAANHVHRRGVMPEKRSIEIVRQVAQALSHAAQHGIVHRDIKPANLLIRRDGAVKLADLGLARSLEDGANAGITRAGTTVGTVDYMAPEQARDSRAADVRSDIYSLGCTWYYLLTGGAPFPEGSLTNKLRAHAEVPLPDPRDKNPAVSEAVVAVLRRMTEKEPEQRYQSAEELLQDLDEAALSRTAVSNVILDDLAESEKRSGKSTSYTAPDQSTADIPAAPGKAAARKAPPRIRVDLEAPESLRAFLFYGGLAAAAVAVLIGIGMLVRQINVTGQPAPQQDASENPFATQVGTTRVVETNDAEAADGAADRVAEAGDPATRQHVPQQALTVRSGQTPAASSRIGDQNPLTVSTTKSGTPIPGIPTPGISAVVGSSTDGTLRRPAASAADSTARGEPLTNRERLENARLPAWVGEFQDSESLTTIVVRPGSDDDRHLQSLDDALAAVPDRGARIVLSGNGPFPVHPVRVEKRTRIILRSQDVSPGAVPLIVVLAGDGQGGSALLEFVNTSLELDGVHVAADAAAFRNPATAAVLHVIDGDLFARRGSLSVRGEPDHPVAAMHLSGSNPPPDRKAADGARLLADRMLIRGDRLTALNCDRDNADVIVRNSLLTSGAAPAVRISGPARLRPEPTRSIRMVSTTVSARHVAVEIGGKPSQPAGGEFVLLNSVVAAPADAETPALLSLPGWTGSELRPGLAKSLTWKSAESAYAGWKRLIATGADAGAAVTTFADWQDVLPGKDAGDALQFLPDGWPAFATPAARAERFSAGDFEPGTIARLQVKTADGGRPGCAAGHLAFTPLDAIDSARVAAARQPLPDDLFSDSASGDTMRIDLTKEDLGEVLSKRKLRSGMLIVASGYGSRRTNPISIRDVWVRLHFKQTDGAPLVLTPQFVDVSRPAEAAQKFDAMISVANGGLEIAGGSFGIPSSDRSSLPRWFIQVTDGDLAMRNCRIVGPMTGTTRNKGLIQWQRATDAHAPERPFAGNRQGYAAFQDCYFASSGTLFDGDLRERALYFRNCVCVSRDDLFQFQLRSADSQIAAVADFQNCTFSAGVAFFRLSTSTQGAPTKSPLEMFADRCVFGPPLRTAQQKPAPVLLVCPTSAFEQRQLRWSESHCGYAHDIVHFHRGDTSTADAPPQDFERDWVAVWGPENVVAPLHGSGQVYLKDELPHKPEERGKLDAESFRLHPSSKAAAWDAGSRPIGADVAVLKAPEPRQTAAPKPATKTPSKVPARNQKPAPKPGF